MTKSPKPFDCKYSPQFAELLHKLNISLAISTYQAGKVIILSAIEKDKLIQLPRTFDNPMGMATAKDCLAVATRNEVIVLRNAEGLAQGYPQKQGVYDGIYVPRASYYTGSIAMHDMQFTGDNKITGVNTQFSCLCTVDDKYSFTPIWKPPFINELASEDRCHLNGIATENGIIKYISALGSTNDTQGWRENKMQGGIIMEYPSGKIIAKGLGMPHSPRIYDGILYVLNSTQGELIKIDPENGTHEVICKLGGFARGMSRAGDYLFIGVSKLRHNSPVFKDLPIAESSFAGVVAIYLPYGSIVGQFEYCMTVDEIYDVKVLPGLKRPSLLSPSMEIHKLALSIPGQTMWGETDKENTSRSAIKMPEATKQNTYNFKLFKTISPSDLVKNYAPLLYSGFATELETEEPRGSLSALFTLSNNQAVGMTVFETSEDKNAKICSVFVVQPFRKQGIAKNMLLHTEGIFVQNKIVYAEASCDKKAENKDIIHKLFKDSKSINYI